MRTEGLRAHLKKVERIVRVLPFGTYTGEREKAIKRRRKRQRESMARSRL